MTIEDGSSDEQVFLRDRSTGAKGALLIGAGVFALFLALLGFVIASRSPAWKLSLHSFSTAPALLGIGFLTAGWSMLRTPRKVVVNREGFWFENAQSQRGVRWDQVGCALASGPGMSHRRNLNVLDVNGKSIVKLDESFDRFELMVKSITDRIQSRSNGAASRLASRKARRQGVIAIVLGCVMALCSGFVAWSTRQKQLGERALLQNPVFAEAEIVRKFVAPNGVTKRIEYRITSEGRSATRNVEVEPAFWITLNEDDLIPVIHVKGDPDFSRLVRGEVHELGSTRIPLVRFGSALAGVVGSLMVIAAGVLLWNGWEVNIDPKTGKWSLKRFGTLSSKSSIP